MAEKKYQQGDGNGEIEDDFKIEEQTPLGEHQKNAEDAQRGRTPARPFAHAKQSVTHGKSQTEQSYVY